MNTSKTFQKRKEDFLCGHCGLAVMGNGYTNHCPRCLYSKHVDVFPGDRLAVCGGLMEPLSCEKERGQEKLIQRCIHCGMVRKNKVHEQDDFEALLELARKRVARS
ncbi:MAG: RNHCP domain-containing protein [Candidatus Moranbacteria bacterium]|nr:RNHCP domain-containing protein [Candidatus Moranbacteria bacterium]